jgi:hypothetical protein
MTALRAWVLMAFVLGLAGCRGDMKDVMTLASTAQLDEPTAVQATAVPKRGMYYLYSTKDDKELARVELRKGEEVGFRRRGNRLEGFAGGTRVELEYDDFKEGAAYAWRMEAERDK